METPGYIVLLLINDVVENPHFLGTLSPYVQYFQNSVKWVELAFYNRKWSIILFAIRIYENFKFTEFRYLAD